MQALGPQQAPPRRVDPHELLEDMRTGGHPEGWEPELWGHLENVHEVRPLLNGVCVSNCLPGGLHVPGWRIIWTKSCSRRW